MIDDNPWQKPPLGDWAICGMNHYHQNGERFLFVSMTKDNLCITAEGPDSPEIWEALARQAAPPQHQEGQDDE